MSDSQFNKQIRLTPLGGGQEIGANSFLLEWGSTNILLDCGMHPAKEPPQQLAAIDRVPETLNAAIITHGHFDHMASVPYLLRSRRVERLITHRAGYRIIRRMLINTSRFMRDHDPVSRLFDYYQAYRDPELGRCFRLMRQDSIEYLQAFQITDTIGGYLFDAGHVLGSAGVVLTDGEYTFCYSGDIHTEHHGIHRGASLPPTSRVDFLLLESTCGSETRTVPEEELQHNFFQLIREAGARNARILIPAFALGRTQDVLTLLQRGIQQAQIPGDLPVFLCGLGNEVTEIYRRHRAFLREDLDRAEFSHWTRLSFEHLETTYLQFRCQGRPAVFIATNGMLNPGTPSSVLARHIVQTAEDVILFSGFQAPGSPGYDLLQAAAGDYFDFHAAGEPVRIVSEHRHLIRLSAHADQAGLLKVVRHFQPRSIALVHGDRQSTRDLTVALEPAGNWRVLVPENGETLLLRHGSTRRACSMRDIPGVVVTVGTSAVTGFRRRTAGSDSDRKGIVQYLAEQENHPDAGCAEIQTLRQLGLTGREWLYFLSSDEPDGYMAASALAEFYSLREFRTEVLKIPGLTRNYSEFESCGLPNFLQILITILERQRGNMRVAATGGFKAETAYATLVGAILKVPVYYIHEDFEHLIEMPGLPATPDFGLLEQYAREFDTVIRISGLTNAVRYLNQKLPKSLHLLFEPDRDSGRLRLTAVGHLLKRLYVDRLSESMSNPVITAKSGKPHLWGGGSLEVDRIPGREVRLILYRIFRPGLLIRQVFFGDTLPEPAAGTHCLYRYSTPDTLVYRLITPLGSQDLHLVSYEGATTRLLAELGRRIFA